MEHILYNVTLTVDPAVETEWCNWMIQHHIPAVCSRPGFRGATMYKIDPLPAASDGKPQYVNSYIVESREALEMYLKSPEAAQYREDHQRRYGQYAIATRAIWTPVTEICSS